MNKVFLIGNLGRDPEVKTVNGGTVARVRIATTETYKKQSGEKVEKTQWHNLVFWNGLAKIVEQYVRKGDKIHVEGKLEYETWEKDGVEKTATKVLVTNLVMLGSPRGSSRPDTAYRSEDDDTPEWMR